MPVDTVDTSDHWFPERNLTQYEPGPSRLARLLSDAIGEDKFDAPVDMKLRNSGPERPGPHPGALPASLLAELKAAGAPPTQFESVWIAWLSQDPEYGVPPPMKRRGGHPPDIQQTAANPATGSMMIKMVIESESSNLETSVSLDRSIPVMFASGTISVSPVISQYRVHCPVYGSFGGSHSEGHIGVLLRSFDEHGNDEVVEARDEKEIWTTRYSGWIDFSDGRGFDDEPHVVGVMTMGQLRASTVIRPLRRYHATTYLRSLADADGIGGLWGSAAGVQFVAELGAIFVREERAH